MKAHRTIKKFLLLFLPCITVTASAAVMVTGEAESTPLFAVQSAERCDTCHVMPDRSEPKWIEENYRLAERKCRLSCGVCHANPTGGMIRNKTGDYFGTKTLPLNAGIDEDVAHTIDMMKTSRFLRAGGDFRFMNLVSDKEGKTEPHYFPMQADLYVDVRLLKHLSLVSQFGMERGGNAAVREVFGQIDNLPYNAYLKAGKFIPPYGHRLEDHTAYIRTKIAFDHSKPESYVSGIEIGVEPLVFFGNAAYFNEDATPAANTGKLRKGVSGVAGWRGLWLHLGASVLDISNFEVGPASSTDRTAYGVFGAVRFRRLAYLFEWDAIRDSIEAGGSRSDVDGTVSFHELDYRVWKGMNAKARFETYDPDRDLSGDDMKRYMAGFDLHPYPFIELNVQFRHTDEPSNDFNEYLIMAHLWF